MSKHMVAAVDFSNVTPIVLEQAASEARLRQAELHLLHVLAPPVAAPVGAVAPAAGLDMTSAIDAAKEELQRAARATKLGGVKVTGHVRVGAAVDEVINLADELDAELIVVGASSKGLAMRALLGSTTRPLISRAPCSLLVARPRAVPEIEPPRPDQDDDIHKRHHKAAHHYSESPERLGASSFRFGIDT